jgi:hypothetical protein
MPTTYQKADDDVIEVLEAALDYHPKLAEARVKFGVLMADNGDEPAVKHGGYPALAKVRVVSLKDRVLKEVDAEILIDRHEWDGMQPAHRVALLDHELSHVTTVPGEENEMYKLDDLGRPKLKTVNGDWNAGDGFAEVVARHGDWSVESLNAKRLSAMIEAAKGGEVPAEKAA